MLAMPGGESTTISRLIHREEIAPEIVAHVEAGKPLLATCAGLIVAAREVPDERVNNLGLLDIAVQRNAFGRQKDSFETTLSVEGIQGRVPAVFIRAPLVTAVGDEVEVLARHNQEIVAVRQGSVLGTAFHPELTAATAIHEIAFGSLLANV